MKYKLLIVVVSLLVQLNFSIAQVNLSKGLIVYYPFSGNTNDASGNNFNAVNLGATLATDAHNNTNCAYEFNGTTSHILLPYNNKFNFAPTDSFTISCWIQPYTNLNWTEQALIVKSPFDVNYQNAPWNYGLYTSLNKAMTGYAANNFLNATNAMQQNSCWYHLAVTYKNGVWVLYLNGKIEAQDASQTKFILQDASVTSIVALGKKGGANGDFYKGKLDEVRIYDRNLSAAEVMALYRTENTVADFSFYQNDCNPKQVIFNNETTNTNKLFWSFGNGGVDSNKTQIVKNYTAFNNYTVQLITLNNFGCYDTIQKTIPVFANFNATIIANKNDTSICSGNSVELKNNNNANSYCWSSTNNSLSGSLLNPTVAPTSLTTYYLTQQTLGNNLVANGDFEQGNTAFETDYIYHPGTAGGVQTIYHVANNPNLWLSAFTACSDHTAGAANDKMMMIDGSTKAGVHFWRQQINVKPNTNYKISFWLQSIVAQNPAVIQLKINGKQISNSLTADLASCSWKNYTAQWFSNSLSVATITLEDSNLLIQGNDFAIDDISVNELIIQQDSININVNQTSSKNISQIICFGDSINGHKTSGSFKDVFTNSSGCDSIVNLTLTVLPAPVLTIDTIKGCGSVVINGIIYTFNQVVGVSLKNQLGCDSINTQHYIEVLAKPTNFINSSQITTCLGDKFSVTGFDNYLWNTGETTASIKLNGLNNYWVEVSNSSGCVGRDSFLVSYSNTFQQSDVNAFSPNGDGVNDEFKPFANSGCLQKYNIVIFNRWGQKIFEKIDPNKGWDGTLNNKPLPVGVYYYIIRFETTTGIKNEKAGCVTLLR